MFDLSIIQRWSFWLQLFLSLLILVLLSLDSQIDDIQNALSQSDWSWLAAALLLKSVTLFIHEFRLWLALTAPRPPMAKTMTIGFASGAINLVLPGRAGDIAAIAMLKKVCHLKPGVAAYAIGMASFFEAAVFGLMLMGVFILGAHQWEAALNTLEHARALNWVSGVTLGGIVVVIIAAVVGQRLSPKQESSEEGFSIRDFILDAFRETGNALSSPKYIVINVLVAGVEVWGMVFSFALGFWALGIDIPTPWTASAVMLGFSALAAVLIPPTYGAGPAAASVFVLSLFGIPQATALAFAALWWLISQVPCALIGVPCIWLLKGSE